MGRFACLGIGAEFRFGYISASWGRLSRTGCNIKHLAVPLKRRLFMAMPGDPLPWFFARGWMGRTRGGAYTTNKKQMKRYTLWDGHGCAACCWTATSAPALLRRAGNLG